MSFGELPAEPDLDDALERADLVVLVTPHTSYDLDAIAERSSVVFDTRNAYRGVGPRERHPALDDRRGGQRTAVGSRASQR